MYRVIACLVYEHDYGLVAVAALVCIVGSCLAVLLSRRMLRAHGLRRIVQLALTGLITGTTIWTTHFIAMLAYDPGVEHGYEPFTTGLSLVIAIFGTLAANAVFGRGKGLRNTIAAGTTFGLTVSIMHYVGMSAYLFPGDIIWHTGPVIASVLLGMGLGTAAFHRITFPVTRYCWLGGAVLMVTAICTMHFTGMSAFTIELNTLNEVPPQLISDTALGFLILAIMVVILLIGFASVSIETNIEEEAKKQLKIAALNDPLTGLPNRLQLANRIDRYAEELQTNPGAKVAVLTIDLNLFKEINDLYGHATGDQVLQVVSERLRWTIEDDEFIARTGGDEFVALKRGFQSEDDVIAFGTRLNDAVIQPIELPAAPVSVRAAIGVAIACGDDIKMDDLLGQSDIAMYRAKSDPENFICIYNAEMDRETQERTLMIYDLRHAVENGEFELVYQLQNDLNSLQPVGFEALLRWNHHQRGPVSPAQFIPIAEETGLIRDIGLWVLRTACTEAASWPTEFSIAVNVAPQQLVQACFVEKVSTILTETGFPPERLELEVTEASIIDDQVRTLKAMHALKAMGIRIAMDDFGTGYSSLSTLQAFPFDKIKIDRSFISDVHSDHQRAAIVRSTLLLGTALGIPVLAEGIEQQEELTFLRSENCAYAQGFYFGKPKTLQEARQIAGQKPLARAS